MCIEVRTQRLEISNGPNISSSILFTHRIPTYILLCDVILFLPIIENIAYHQQSHIDFHKLLYEIYISKN